MRLRNITGSQEIIAESQYVVHEPEHKKGCWCDYFGNNHPIHIEIGMGKGRFITTLALQNPEINYIGIEKYSSVLLRAIERRQEMECTNLIFLRFDAEYICNIFDKDEIERIYLNFSDPWPKDRHAKRRLTSKEFLERYHQFLKLDGSIQFKTDNQPLFDFSLEQAETAGWKLKDITYNLHQSEQNYGNIMTEYEERFSLSGNPIFKLTSYR